MWVNVNTASEFPCSRAHVRGNVYVRAAKSASLKFFDVNRSVPRPDRKRRAPGIQFSAHGGMAQRAGNLNWDVQRDAADRKSTRLNSSHMSISYAVFCLKKKK